MEPLRTVFKSTGLEIAVLILFGWVLKNFQKKIFYCECHSDIYDKWMFTVDCYWNLICFFLLQPLQVNLNLTLCPMELDPFYGPYYRIIAVAHQAILCPLTCKVFCAISSLFTTPKQHLCDSSCECSLVQCSCRNSHLHKD